MLQKDIYYYLSLFPTGYYRKYALARTNQYKHTYVNAYKHHTVYIYILYGKGFLGGRLPSMQANVVRKESPHRPHKGLHWKEMAFLNRHQSDEWSGALLSVSMSQAPRDSKHCTHDLVVASS